jgi:acetyl esterase
MLRKSILLAMGLVIVLFVAIYIAFQLSPWPWVLYYRLHGQIREIKDHGWFRVQEAPKSHFLPGVTARLNERYNANDRDALLDVFYPSEFNNSDRKLPTIVWIHGGGFIDGNKNQIASYLQILTTKNYTVVGVNYSLAPGKIYPMPILQVNAALAFLSKNEVRLHVDASKLFLAGDSAGAQIAAQVAAVISSASYAKRVGVSPSVDRQQLRGMILHCGLYDLRDGSSYRRVLAWSYFGTKDFASDPRFQEFSVAENITANFPPIFISVGNADGLAPQSQMLAKTATKLNILVDSLFFPDDYTPPLPHEYQFNLDSKAGQIALERTVRFLRDRLQ